MLFPTATPDFERTKYAHMGKGIEIGCVKTACGFPTYYLGMGIEEIKLTRPYPDDCPVKKFVQTNTDKCNYFKRLLEVMYKDI